MAQPAIVTTARGLVLVIPWLIWLLVADIILSLLLVARAVLSPTAVYNLSSHTAASVWLWIQHIFETANGAEITTSGDPLPRAESAIVVANHVAWADFYMIQHLAVRSGMLGRCRYFAKAQLKRVPFLGWGLWAMGMPLVTRKWAHDRRELDRVFGGIAKGRWPIWLISYSEATRFTPRKHAESQAWCAANGRPQPRHLLYPRTKGFVATVRHLRAAAPHVRAVYDLTIAYADHTGQFGAAPSMWETLSAPGLSAAAGTGGEGYRFHVHARRFPLEDLPPSDEELAAWLESRWVEKGEWLEGKRLEWAASPAEG
ncbi:uncharacterized protein E0L32_009742 [Thyridium curvatum]|uniref:Phospholipid/glycerol acyltransferase domain-containing protein n=1 Tax=Thyridium curvatum TaxID=1093900 RepID=A0A507AI26_9PEZI|nr:uncharacterized protein E0L32_009742 [Thyridium curvatum]TPX08802.1 hypothetical protein E0L32_009742 [Thyridium curvatum]